VLRAFHQPVRVGRLREREGLEDLRPDPASLDERPDFFAKALGEGALVLYRSRAQRDRINKRVMKQFMADPKWKKYMDPKNMPFDGKRMFWGGFKPIVEF
jgi:hypothetical protein